jgi:hypothetical protein
LTGKWGDYARPKISEVFLMTHEARKSKAGGKSSSPDKRDDKKHLDDELTRALKDTFPGSDPVEVTQPPPSHYDKDRI